MRSIICICNSKLITREEWLSYRRTGIGGSDSSVIVGLNPYKSKLELYTDKLGLLPEKEETEQLRIGRDLEDYVAKRFSEETGKKIKRNNFMWRSKSFPFMIADVDREIIGENAGLECKTTSVWNKSDFDKGDIPLTYYVQCMHYMAVMGYERMYLAVLVLSKGFFWYVVERDEDEIKSLIQSENEFWECVSKETPPDPDGSESSEKAINIINNDKEKNDDCINIIEYENYVSELDELTKEYKELEKKIEEKKQKLKIILNNHSYGQTSTYDISYLKQTRKTIDNKLLLEKYPDIYSECSKETEYYRFNFKKKKE